MDYSKLMDTAILAGEIMLKSGAESYRVEGTMNYILKTSNLETTEAFAITTGLVATLDDPKIDAITIVKRIQNRDTNLNKIYEVNIISRNLSAGTLALDDAYQALKGIKEAQYKTWVKNVAIIVLVASFALLLGGGFLEVAAAGIDGVFLVFAVEIGKKIGMSSIIRNLISSACVAIGATLLRKFFILNLNVDIVIVATIMPLVPGTAITNAIRDTLQGDYMSGGAKTLEAFVIAFSIALGIGIGLVIMGGGKF